MPRKDRMEKPVLDLKAAFKMDRYNLNCFVNQLKRRGLAPKIELENPAKRTKSYLVSLDLAKSIVKSYEQKPP